MWFNPLPTSTPSAPTHLPDDEYPELATAVEAQLQLERRQQLERQQRTQRREIRRRRLGEGH